LESTGVYRYGSEIQYAPALAPFELTEICLTNTRLLAATGIEVRMIAARVSNVEAHFFITSTYSPISSVLAVPSVALRVQ